MTSYRMKYKIGLTEYLTTIPQDLNNKVVNHLDKITASGTWTAPLSTWYKFTLKGAGGGGSNARYVSGSTSYVPYGGGGGGEGGTLIFVKYLEKDTTVSITIGAGGTGGAFITTNAPTSAQSPTSGGSTIVNIGTKTYTANGGSCGAGLDAGQGGGTSYDTSENLSYVYAENGCSGCVGTWAMSVEAVIRGGTGGGRGGKSPFSAPGTVASLSGGGGCGGSSYGSSSYQRGGGNGGNGFVTVEYFDPSLNP